MRKKKGEELDGGAAGGRLTPADVQQIEFRLAFRGYNERDVDAFLDRITEDLSAYQEEAERLRSSPAAPPPAPPAPTTPAEDAEARRTADDIVARARAEAAGIVRRAEQDAATIRAAAPTGGGDARHAVGPFLNQEREFLQSLGSLVQTHAEDIKRMVLAVRSRAGAPAPGDGPAAQPVEAPAVAAAATGAASAAEIRDRLGEPSADPEPGRSDDDDAPPIVVENATEPAYSAEGAAPAGEARERSLRELFWGDDSA
jgi:DivIVA domain-containing protein